MEKPTVTYTDVAPGWVPRINCMARVQVLDHPNHLPGSWVHTTRVQRIDGAKFETLNTRYIPGLTDPMPAASTQSNNGVKS